MLTINNLTLVGGFSLTNGGAISVIDAALLLNNSVVSGSGARGFGGGIYALNSDIELIDSVVSGNTTGANAEDYVPVEEPEVLDEGDQGMVTDDGETAQSEGAEVVEAVPQTELEPEVDPTEEPAEVELPEVDGMSGGGIYFEGETNSLIISRSGLDSNVSPEDGGGVYITSGTATISNSTISGNTAGGTGGGVYNASGAKLTHVTVVENSATEGGGIVDNATLQLYNSILSANSVDDCVGSLNANLGNIIADGSCDHDGLTADPDLLLLAGSPSYYLPQNGSPAIDAAVAEFCTAADQRSVDRLPDTCDIGAAEHQPGIFEFQIQSALTLLSPPEPGPVTTPEPVATAEPVSATPVPPSCSSLPSHITVTGASSGTECRILDQSGVGNQTIIDGGMIYALDIYGAVSTPVTACFQHDNSAVILLDAANTPRNIVPLRTWTASGHECALVDRPGSAVLMPIGFFTSGAIPEPIWDLSDCSVTTTDILNLRQGPGSSTSIVANVLNDETLTADQKATHYYRVNYYGIVGWLSADYLSFNGTCD